MVADSQGRHTYYHCSGNVDHVSTSMPRRCPAPLVYAPDLDRLVWKEMTSLLSSPETMLEAYKQQRGKNGLRGPDVLEAELQRLDERVGDVERQIQRLPKPSAACLNESDASWDYFPARLMTVYAAHSRRSTAHHADAARASAA